MSPAPARRARAMLAGLIALAALAGGVSSLAGAPSALAATPRTTLPVIERQVMCVTCKIPLNVAQSPQADRERAFIQELIDQGDGEGQIKTALVGQYGPAVLGLPEAHGFDLAAYLIPLAAAVLLIGAFLLLLPRWRRQARANPVSLVPAASLSQDETARLDADLARFD